MAKKQPWLDVTVQVPMHQFQSVHEYMSDWLSDESDANILLTEENLLSNEKVMSVIVHAITEDLQRYAEEFDVYDMDFDMYKLFKKEIAEFRKLIDAQIAESKKAVDAEKERLKKEGVSLNVPVKDAERAIAILRAAGIKV